MTGWNDILGGTTIDRRYWDKIMVYLNNVFINNDKDNFLVQKTVINLKILQSIDLTKVIFTTNKSICGYKTIKAKINSKTISDMVFDEINVDDELLRILTDELRENLKKEIQDNNGIIIYNLVNNIKMYYTPDGSLCLELDSSVSGYHVVRMNKLRKIKHKLWLKGTREV